jgi:hypothetical protein
VSTDNCLSLNISPTQNPCLYTVWYYKLTIKLVCVCVLKGCLCAEVTVRYPVQFSMGQGRAGILCFCRTPPSLSTKTSLFSRIFGNISKFMSIISTLEGIDAVPRTLSAISVTVLLLGCQLRALPIFWDVQFLAKK